MCWIDGAKEDVRMHIIQFIHPGPEFPINDNNSNLLNNGSRAVRWSTEGRHYRRLVKHQGSFVDGNHVNEDMLAFWTEWEGPTVATRFNSSTCRLCAKYYHEVQKPTVPQGVGNRANCRAGANNGLLNTDPCVFGDTFKYALCQQRGNGILRRLEENSLILFLSRIQGTYYLDTLFVVGESRDYTTGPANNIICSNEYRTLTLDRLQAGQNFTFYRGKRYPQCHTLFSFTPAKVWSSDDDVRARCPLNLQAINQIARRDIFSTRLTQGFKATISNANLVSRVWNEIVRQVRQNQFVLGSHFSMP